MKDATKQFARECKAMSRVMADTRSYGTVAERADEFLDKFRCSLIKPPGIIERVVKRFTARS